MAPRTKATKTVEQNLSASEWITRHALAHILFLIEQAVGLDDYF